MYGATTLLYVITRVVQAPFALTIAVALPSSLLLAGIIAAILLTPLEGQHQDRTLSPRVLAVLRAPALIAVIAIVISALAGYLALARFLAQQLVVTGSILAFAYLLLLWVDGLIQGLGDDRAATGRWLKARVGEQHRRREQLALPVGLFLKGVVIILAVPLHSAAVGLHVAGRLRLVHAALLRFPDWKHANINCGSTRFGDRVRACLWRRAIVPGLARPAGPQAGRHFGRPARFDSCSA